MLPFTPSTFRITEVKGQSATRAQLDFLYMRYHFASEYCQDKLVLEVACGSGIGLSYLAKRAKELSAGDILEPAVEFARKAVEGNKKVSVSVFNAEALPFEEKSFEIVLILEALYFLERPEVFIQEAYRVLKPGGLLIISSVNSDWREYTKPAYVRTHLNKNKLESLFQNSAFSLKFYGAFPTHLNGQKERFIGFLRRTATSLKCIPKSIPIKELYKRVFYGKLLPIPSSLGEGEFVYSPPEKLNVNDQSSKYKILYLIAKRSNES